MQRCPSFIVNIKFKLSRSSFCNRGETFFHQRKMKYSSFYEKEGRITYSNLYLSKNIISSHNGRREYFNVLIFGRWIQKRIFPNLKWTSFSMESYISFIRATIGEKNIFLTMNKNRFCFITHSQKENLKSNYNEWKI